MKKIALALVAAAGFAGHANAADLGSPRTPIAAAVVSPVFNWTGFYVGADLGYWTSTTSTFVPGVANTLGSPKPNGVTLGGHLGYRYQFANNVVLGAEADLSWLGGKTAFGPIAGALPAAWSLRAGWDGSIRGTAGYAVNRALLYVTGGLSFIDAKGCGINNPAVSTACVANTSYGNTRLGWTLGAGIDYAVAQNWTVRGEYLYANYGTRSYATPGTVTGTTASRLETHKFRVGLTYLFSTGASAVVARY